MDYGTIYRWRRNDGLVRAQARDRRLAGDRDPCDRAHAPDPEPYAYLLGIYLGDGHIVRVRNTDRLRVYQDHAYPDLVTLTETAMRAVFPDNKVISGNHGQGCVASTVYSNHATCLFPQHGPGVKHTRKIRLEPWQQEIVEGHPWRFIAGLMHSDGCRSINRVKGREYPRWEFKNLSVDIHGLCQDALTEVGLHWTKSWKKTYVSRASDVAEIDANIAAKS